LVTTVDCDHKNAHDSCEKAKVLLAGKKLQNSNRWFHTMFGTKNHLVAFLAIASVLCPLHEIELFGFSQSRCFVSAQNQRVHPFDSDTLDHCMAVDARVCLDEETRRCEPNYLKRPTITLTAGPTDSSVIIAWVAQIIIGEALKFPVHVNGDGLGSHNFYEEGSWRLNKPRRFTFDAIQNADRSPDLSCSVTYKASLDTPKDLINEPVCQVCSMLLFVVCCLLFVVCCCLLLLWLLLLLLLWLLWLLWLLFFVVEHDRLDVEANIFDFLIKQLNTNTRHVKFLLFHNLSILKTASGRWSGTFSMQTMCACYLRCVG
jgi:hypothetical protein